VNVDVIGDTVPEPNEVYFVQLSNPGGGAVIGNAVGQGKILNDDSGVTPAPTPTPTPVPTATPTPTPTPVPQAPPALSINDSPSATVSSDCYFTVTLSRAAGNIVTVNFASEGGGSQVSSTNGTLTFAPGETSKPVVVDVIKQKKKKGEVEAVLSNATGGATIRDARGKCVIKKRARKHHR
jgi:hypothetical protein